MTTFSDSYPVRAASPRYVGVTQYWSQHQDVSRITGSFDESAVATYVHVALLDRLMAPAVTNAALTKFYDEMGQASNLAVAWLEREKAVEQLTTIMSNTVKIIRGIRRRDPRLMRQILKHRPQATDIAKQPASVWLGYWFGIVPTLSDIHEGAQLLTRDLPGVTVEASSGDRGIISHRQGLNGSYEQYVKIGCKVRVNNPNRVLASRFGLDQPLSIGWELIPFSWLVDYFVNFGELLSNLEPRFPGFEINYPYTSYFIKFSGYFKMGPPYADQFLNVSSSHLFSRMEGLPSYQLSINKNPLNLKRLSYITAVAIQLLLKTK